MNKKTVILLCALAGLAVAAAAMSRFVFRTTGPRPADKPPPAPMAGAAAASRPADPAGEGGEAGTPAAFYPADDPGYKTTGNARFNFWFDLPAAWGAEDRSANDDGYYILHGGRGAVISIYGARKLAADEDEYELIRGRTGKMADFRFGDGAAGKCIVNEQTRHYLRDEGDHWVCLYVKCGDEWYRANEEAILRVARSIRPGK